MIMCLSTVGISCTLMVLWEALELGLGSVLSTEWCAFLSFGPTILYIIVCFKASQKTQLFWAHILTGKFYIKPRYTMVDNYRYIKTPKVVYAIVMILMTVSIMISSGECPLNLTVFFLLFLAGIHILAAILHWDWVTLFCGIIYWVGMCF